MTVWDQIATPEKGGFSLRVEKNTSYGNWSWVKEFDARVGIALEMRANYDLTNIAPTRYFDVSAVEVPHIGKVLTITCKDNEFYEIFEVLCRDLIETASKADDLSAALALVADRVSIWTKLFSRGYRGLSQSDVYGLAAELSFMERWLSNDFKQGIDGWAGPYGAPQDFVSMKLQKAFEVKARSDSHNLIKISSLEQLEFDGDLYLATFPIAQIKEGEHFHSLDQLVSNVEGMLNSHDQLQFHQALLNVGYVHGEHEGYRMRIGEPDFYIVNPGFPRLIRSNTPLELVSCRYELNLEMCKNFVIKYKELVEEWTH